MSRVDIVRAWKDEEYRASLTDAERASLPANPAGLVELDDEEMKKIMGAGGQQPTTTATTALRYCG
jgi:mersacidin/lichenicidin family type 2 lantibiotic